MKKIKLITLTLIIIGISGIFLNANNINDNSNSIGQQTFFEDHFSSVEYTSFYWDDHCDRNSHLVDGSYPSVEDAIEHSDFVAPNSEVPGNFYSTYYTSLRRRGHCSQFSGKINFVTMPFDKRGAWEESKNKGGGEITQRYKSNASDSARLAIVEDGVVVQKGWDFKGETYLQDNSKVAIHYRFKIKDIRMLEDNLSSGFYIFQQHTQSKNQCNVNYTDFSLKSMAPTAGLILKKDEHDGKYYFRFRTKTRDHPYYRSAESISEVCKDKGKDICSIKLWEKEFDPIEDLNKWFEVIVEMKVAGQMPFLQSCPEPLATLNQSFSGQSQTMYQAYKDCRPSRGYLSLIFNGKRVKGNGRDLPWITNRKYFRGVTTKFNDCPSYFKIGEYALDYANPEGIHYENGVPPKIEVKYDYFKITRKIIDNLDSSNK